MSSPTTRPAMLVTEGSSSSSRQTLLSLGRGFDIDLLDPNPLCQSRFSRYVRRWHRCPAIARDPTGYLRTLLERLRDTRYDVLLPTHEQVYLISRFRDQFSKRIGVAVPDFDALRLLQSKSDFARLLDELDIPGPPTQILSPDEARQKLRDFPRYVKLPHSTAGLGVRLVRNRDELLATLELFERSGRMDSSTELVIQRPLDGHLFLVAAVFQNGRLVGAHCSEGLSLGIGGGQMIRRGVSHPIVLEHLARIGGHLQWHGAMFLEYFYDDATATPRYIEANPRIGETVNAMLSGINLPRLLVRISMGEQVDPAPPTRPGVCTHNGFLRFLAAAIDGASRRELIAMVLRNVFRRSYYRNNEMMRIREDCLSMMPAGFVTAKILLSPSCGQRIVDAAVDHYSVPESTARVIDAMEEVAFDGLLSKRA